MSSDKVLSLIENAFEGVQSAQFLRCEPSYVLCLHREQELDGGCLLLETLLAKVVST